jgi:hypothetical protein
VNEVNKGGQSACALCVRDSNAAAMFFAEAKNREARLAKILHRAKFYAEPNLSPSADVRENEEHSNENT